MRGREGSLKQGPLYVIYPKFVVVPFEHFKFKFRSAESPWVPRVPKGCLLLFSVLG